MASNFGPKFVQPSDGIVVDYDASLARAQAAMAAGMSLDDAAAMMAAEELALEDWSKYPIPESDDDLKTAQERDDRPVHRAADSRLKSFTVAVQYAFAMGRKKYRATKSIDKTVAAVKAALLNVLPDEILKAIEAGGNAGAKELKTAEFRAAKRGDPPIKKIGPIKMTFDITSPEAIKWARERAAELAKDLSDTTRDDIKTAIADSLEFGDDPYDDILDAVGSEARASVIARTETMMAANEGQRQSWEQAVEDGLLPEGAQKVWIATSGCCDECDALDGTHVDLDEEYPDEGGDGPPLHPNCRCTEGIVSGGEE